MAENHSEVVGILEVATVSRPHPDQSVSGDATRVLQTATGLVVVIVDGLGHGEEAAAAAAVALDTAQLHAQEEPEAIVQACHLAMRKTRGCVMAVASIADAGEVLHWCGVGNIAGLIWSDAATRITRLGSRPGIVGYRIPSLRAQALVFQAGDVLVMATDGVHERGLELVRSSAPPQMLAQLIHSGHARDDDDSLVVVARRMQPPVTGRGGV